MIIELHEILGNRAAERLTAIDADRIAIIAVGANSTYINVAGLRRYEVIEVTETYEQVRDAWIAATSEREPHVWGRPQPGEIEVRDLGSVYDTNERA